MGGREETWRARADPADDATRAYYRETWGFDPAHVRRGPEMDENYVTKNYLEDGFPLDAPGDELLDHLDITLWARVVVPCNPELGPWNRLVFCQGGAPGDAGTREAAVRCVHLAVYAAPLAELADMDAADQAELARSTEHDPAPVDIPPLEHFAALRSFAAGLADLGVHAVLATGGRALGFNSYLVQQLGKAVATLVDGATRRRVAGQAHFPTAGLATTLLDRLAGDEEGEVRVAVAGNPNAPPKLLERLAGDGNWKVGAAVTGNPTAPATLLERLAGDRHWKVRATLAGNPTAPATLLERLAGDGNGKVRAAVAGNPSCPPDLQPLLAWTTGDGLATKAEDPACPAAALVVLVKDENWRVRAAVAKNPTTPAKVLASLAKEQDFAVLLAVAGNPNAPAQLLRQVVEANRADEDIRAAVAGNPGTPDDLLEELAVDEKRHVRAAVAGNPSCPPDLQPLLAWTTGDGLAAKAEDPACPAAALVVLVKDEKWRVRAAVAKNPTTPVKLLASLAKEDDFAVLFAVAGNPNAPAQLLRQVVEAHHADEDIRAAVAGNPSCPPDLQRLDERDSEAGRAAPSESGAP